MNRGRKICAVCYLASAVLPVVAQQAGSESAGAASIALQGYYAGQSSAYWTDITGVAADFRVFIPRAGLLRGSFQGYGREGALRLGDNYLELSGVRWQGRHWTFTGGDFRFSASMAPFPFYNVYYPELAARGFRIETSTRTRQIGVFFGQETILDGPRVPFRRSLPQRTTGAYLKQRIGSHLQVAARVLRLTETGDLPEQKEIYLLPNRRFPRLNTATVQSLYSATSNLRFFSEVSGSFPGAGAGGISVSWLTGAVWESRMLLARANYVSQTASYLPLYGYFLGDRRGPFGEIRFRPWKRMELSGSASRYENNLERRADALTARSTSMTAGAAFALPFRFNLSGQASAVRYSSSRPAEAGWFDSDNRQLTTSLSRPIRRHTPRISFRELDLNTKFRAERQRTVEAEDIFQYKRLVLGGAARLQSIRAEERRHTVFVRGLAQVNLGRVSAHANVESGNDLVNRTVFATNTFSTTVVGISASLGSGWSFQAEAFRNRLIMDLNPESIFLLQNRGLALSGALGGYNQWSLYVRMIKQIQWGVALPASQLEKYAAERVPLTGSIEGVVYERGMNGVRPAGAGVAVILDGTRGRVTDAEGRFQFEDVAEGSHRVGLKLDELPAAYDPGPNAEVTVVVRPRRVARADLDVLPLGRLQGRVKGPPGASMEGIVIRLSPTGRYTVTDGDGAFTFHNLREGRYQVILDQMSLPAGARLTTEGAVQAVVDASNPPEGTLEFEFSRETNEKPIRKVLELDLTATAAPK